jgi:hypothetical protein
VITRSLPLVADEVIAVQAITHLFTWRGLVGHYRAAMVTDLFATFTAVLLGCVLSAALGFFLDL